MEVLIVLRNACLFLSVVCILCIPSSASSEECEPPAGPDSMVERYRNWLEKHGRKYKDRDEWEQRFGIYQSNVQFIEFINSQNLSFTLVDNKFADMTNEEYKSIYLGFKKIKHFRKNQSHEHHGCMDLPSSVDWRTSGAVTPIKDQGQCGTQTDAHCTHKFSSIKHKTHPHICQSKARHTQTHTYYSLKQWGYLSIF